MPRQYVRPDEVLFDPVLQTGGWAVGSRSLIGEEALNRLIAQASTRIDRATHRLLGLPGASTLSADTASGATILPVTSMINLDHAPAMLLQIGTGATQEIVQSGSYAITTWKTPIPGTITLYPGTSLAFAHSAGEPVAAYFYEQVHERASGTSPTDQYFELTQEGQIAYAHAPRMAVGASARHVFLSAFPILQIFRIGITYPWSNGQNQAPPSDLYIAFDEGWVRFPVGYYVPQDSTATVAYTGGYSMLPDDLQRAVVLEIAGQLALARNPDGALSVGSGVRHVSWGQGKRNRANLLSEEAAEICANYVNLAVA